MCGECCGAGIGVNPWPKEFISSIDNWSRQSTEKAWPHIRLFSWTTGERIVSQTRGVAEVDGVQFPYVIHEGYLCKDDGKGEKAKPNKECPFLLEADDQDQHKCGLHSTSAHDCWETHCKEGSSGVGNPPIEVNSAADVDYWFTRHPSCSFTYEEI